MARTWLNLEEWAGKINLAADDGDDWPDPAWRHRTIRFVIDENLAPDFAEWLGRAKRFRTYAPTPRMSDQQVWDMARKLYAVVVTNDLDFWGDVRFPLERSPGLIVVEGRTTSEHIDAFQHAWSAFGEFVLEFRGGKMPLERVKLKGTPHGWVDVKLWDGHYYVSDYFDWSRS